MSSTSTTMSLGNPVVQNLHQSGVVRKTKNSCRNWMYKKHKVQTSNRGSYSSNHACPLELGFSDDDILLC